MIKKKLLLLFSLSICLIHSSFAFPHNTSENEIYNNVASAPFTIIEAESYNAMFGIQTEACSDLGGGLNVGFADADDYLVYNNVDLGTGAFSLDMRIASGASFVGTAEFRTGSAAGTLIATVNFGSTGGWQSWVTKTVAVSGASGIQNIYIVFKGGISIGNVNWFKFNASPLSAPTIPLGVTATGVNTAVILNWSVSSSAVSYNILRGTVSGGPYTPVQTGVTATTFTNTGLTNGITYYYVITAVNSVTESAYSSQVIAIPQITTRVICIGNSITAGAGVANPVTQSYPAQLGASLGSGYTVFNFGNSGKTMMKNGDDPYWNTIEYANAIASNPDIVVIKLGTNDSKTWNWTAHGAEYPTDYKSMIDAFRSLPSNPKIFVTMASKAFSGVYGIDETVLANNIRLAQVQVAKDKGVSVIDMYDATKNASANFPDGVHPNAAGALIIATKVKDLITYPVPAITRSGDILMAPAANAYQWYLNNTLISAANGGTNRSLPINGTGNYTVSLRLNTTNEDRVVTNAFLVNNSGSIPAAPASLIAGAGNGVVILNWVASSGADTYTISRSSVSGGPYSLVQSGISSTSFTNTGLVNGTPYYYVVTAINSNGESVNSVQASATPLITNIQEPDKAYYFNGNDGVQALVDNPHADGQPGPFDAMGTVEGWIRPNWVLGTHTADPTIFSMIDWWGTRWGIVMGKDYGSIGFIGTNASYLNYTFKKGIWYHIAAVFNPAGNITVYVNGINIGTSTSVLSAGITGTPFKIGISWSWATNEQFEGGLDEVRVWKTRRTAAEIAANFLTVTPTSNADLMAYYKFNQSSGTVLPDVTSNGHNGSMIFWNNAPVAVASPTWVESYALAIPTAIAPTAITTTTFSANWVAPLFGVVNNYLLDVSTDRNFTTFVTGYNRLNVGNVTSYPVTGLSPSLKYYYRISANKTSVNNQGGYSNLATTVSYSFIGSGNWNNDTNWYNNIMPPATLDPGAQIIIDPVNGGECFLNIPYTVSAGAGLSVMAGKKFRMSGNLKIIH